MSATSVKNVKNIFPLLDRVLVQRIKAQTKTASGLYIPEKNVEKLSEADVIAVGPGAANPEGKIQPPTVKSGDRVLIPPYGGATIKVGDQDFVLFRDSDILAKVQE